MSSGAEKIQGYFSADLELRGERVVLRAPVECDEPVIQRILSDPKTMEHLQYMAHLKEGGWTLEQVQKRHSDRQLKRAKQECLDFIVHDAKSDEVLGSCGFTSIDLTHKNGVFGLIIHYPYWRKGVATDCHLLCLDYAFSTLGLHRVEFTTSTKNVRMRQFFAKVGIAFEAEKKKCYLESGEFKDEAVYALFANQWSIVKSALESRLRAQSIQPKSNG